MRFLLILATTALALAAEARYPNPVDVKLSPDGSRLYVLCQGTNELAVLSTATRAVIGQVAVGNVPRGLTLSTDGKRAYVTNSWSDTVSEIDTAAMRVTRTLKAGFEPSGAAIDSRGEFLYVANRISNDVSVIDLKSGEDIKRLAAGRGASYLTTSPDRAHIYVTHIYPNLGPYRTQPESELTSIDTGHQIVDAREPLHNVAGMFQITLSADAKLGIAGIMRPKNLIPLAHVSHGFAFANSLAVFGSDVGGKVLQMPLDELDKHFSLPFSIAISSDKSRAYVTASGGDELAILDLRRLVEAARSPNRDLVNDLSASEAYVIARVPVGRNPRGIALTTDGSKLYIANRLDDSVSVFDTAQRKVTATISLGGSVEQSTKRRGERLFYTAKFAFHGAFACANCHIDSTFDGLAWDLEPDGFGVDIVDNRALEDVSETPPYKWNGSNPDLETECGPRTERFFFRSEGYNKSELSDLVTYIKGIPLRPNRYRLPNDELTAAQERGKAIFERTTRNDGTPLDIPCSVCHYGKYYTNQLQVDVGSGKPTDRSPLVDVPQLTNVALTAPYMHDGAARTLEEIWTVFNPKDTHGTTNDLTKDQLNDLIEYLKTL